MSFLDFAHLHPELALVFALLGAASVSFWLLLLVYALTNPAQRVTPKDLKP